MKECYVCRDKKEVSEFNVNNFFKDKLSVYCRECERLLQRTKYRNNKVHQRLYQTAYRDRNRLKFRLLNKTYRENVKRMVLKHYGDKCACCDETESEFLTIDHVNNDGAAHRKELGVSSVRIHRWLKKNNFPPGFQILCMNCNFAKGHHFTHTCPHKRHHNL